MCQISQRDECVYVSCVPAGNVGSAPAAAALHTLTLAGSSCVQLGGTGALGPTASVHLLQSPALQASLSQQQQLTDTLAQLAEARSAVGALQAQADVLVWEKEHAVQQAQVCVAGCTHTHTHTAHSPGARDEGTHAEQHSAVPASAVI